MQGASEPGGEDPPRTCRPLCSFTRKRRSESSHRAQHAFSAIRQSGCCERCFWSGAIYPRSHGRSSPQWLTGLPSHDRRSAAAALAILKKRLKAAKGAYLFPRRKDDNQPILKVNNSRDRALEKSKIRYFHLYDLRHIWATRAAESGQVDMPTLAALLGHSKLNMVMRYADPQEEHQIEAVKKLEKANAAQQIAEFKRNKNGSEKTPPQFPLQWPKIPPIFQSRKPNVSLSRSTKRRRSDSNRCIKVLQTSPLPLGYGAL